MGRWLRNFTVRTLLGAETFLLAAFIAVAVAFLAVSFKSVKAALANPVESLRYE
jgi:putative ABC transport system permease protein